MAETARTDRPARRDFITQMAGAFVGVGGAMALWPFIDHMNPNDATPRPPVTEVDLAPIQPGQAVSVLWRGKPVFIRHRTRDEIQQARETALHELPDRLARNDALPGKTLAYDDNRIKEGHDNWLVVVGLCTHLGCILQPRPVATTDDAREAWFCPCHAARFDVSGRVRSGPASTNLPVPPYRFVTSSKIRIG